MASLEQHNRDCLKYLGNSFEPVNLWLDELFARYGPYHRRFRHHREGIEEVRSLFGDQAAVAAAIHILRDCRHIPTQKDYDQSYVDALGLKRNWSTAAYVLYSEGDFNSLVEHLLKPSGLVLWSFVDFEALRIFLLSFTRIDDSKISDLRSSWQQATEKRQTLPPLKAVAPNSISVERMSGQVAEYITALQSSPLFKSISPLQEPSIAMVPIEQLVNPLVYLDFEYLDSLKPELAGEEDIDIYRFALPQTLGVHFKAVMDAAQRTVTFVSNEKTVTVYPMQVSQTPQGTEVKFTVAASVSMVVVSQYADRLVIRNGIHRAFLLAERGMKFIPCVLIKERGAIPNLQISAYPAFTASVLSQERPPLLSDFFDPELCLRAPLQRSHKVIRISAEEQIIPID